MDARKFIEFMNFCKKNNITPTVEEIKAWWSLEKLRMTLSEEKGKKDEKVDTWI